MSWQIDRSHSSVRFSVRHLMFAKVHGRFRDFDAKVELDGERPVAVEAQIRVASVDTDEPARDTHLRSADFFDADTHPLMTFRGENAREQGAGRYTLEGQLTIRGTTRPVTLQLESLGRARDPWGNDRVAFTATTQIDRREFGLTWNQALETGGVIVGDRVDISLEVQAVPVRVAA
ncbi:MAG: YceI family protein [Myxococcota bacterium]